MGKITSWMDRTFYPDFQNNWDDQIFRKRILECIDENSIILDIGAGAGIVPQMNFKGKAAKVFGVDPDPRVLDNKYLDEGKIGVGEKIPYPDDFFDLVYADNVMEHLPIPVLVMKEIGRVLKPNGLFLGKTPNRYHYMPLISMCTPTAFHKFVNKKRGRNEDDTFKTCYLMNSKKQVDKVAQETGFSIEEFNLYEA